MDDDRDRAWAVDLLAEVDRTFARTGAATPGWPDPWPERDAPQAAYSRVTDPGRHRILDARLAAWEEVLVDRGLARVERPEALTWVPSPRLPQLGGQPTLLVPTAPGALTFVAVSAAAGDLPVLEVGARAPDTGAALLDVHPACGCDACDSGSADLLQVLDASVLTVVRGGVVLVRAGRREVARTWDGWAASGVADPAWLGDPTAAPEGALVVRGAPWL